MVKASQAGVVSSSSHGTPCWMTDKMAANNVPIKPDMVQVSAAYMQIIKEVGAKGTETSVGELFTLKELCFYLKEYIKRRCLYNPLQPLEVRCQNDPLGKVFGVDRFTFFNAVQHVQKQTRPVLPPTSAVSRTPASVPSSVSSSITSSSSIPSNPQLSTSQKRGLNSEKVESKSEQAQDQDDNDTSVNATNATNAVTSHKPESDCVTDSPKLPFEKYTSVQEVSWDSSETALNKTSSSKTSLLDNEPTTQWTTYKIPGTDETQTAIQTFDPVTRTTTSVLGKITKTPPDAIISYDPVTHTITSTKIPEKLSNTPDSRRDSDDDDEFYFRSQRASNEETKSDHPTKTGLSLDFADGCESITEQKTPERQIQSWADVKVPEAKTKVPSERLRRAFTFTGGEENEGGARGGGGGADDEGVYDCEPSTSQAPPKPKQGERRRQSSLSIICTSEPSSTSSYPWRLRLEIDNNQDDDDAEEVLSIQSKETVLVKDSSDDYWFLEDSDDDEEEEDAAPEGSGSQDTRAGSFSVRRISVELPGGFEEEYEVDSGTDHEMVEGSEEESESTEEEIIVLCPPRAACDWDIEFWADSESSDADSSDDEIDPKDKWRCEECNILNSPLHRYCDQCFKLRPDWLPSNPASRQSSPGPAPKATAERVTQRQERRRRTQRTQGMYRHSTLPFTPQSSQETSQENSQQLEEPGPSHSYLNSESLRRMESGEDLLPGNSAEDNLNQYLQPPKITAVSKLTEGCLEFGCGGIGIADSQEPKCNDTIDTTFPTSSEDASQFSQVSISDSLPPVTTSSDQMSSQNSEIMLRRTDTNDTLPSNEIDMQVLDDFRNEEHHLNSTHKSPNSNSPHSNSLPQPRANLKRTLQMSPVGDRPPKLKKTGHVTSLGVVPPDCNAATMILNCDTGSDERGLGAMLDIAEAANSLKAMAAAAKFTSATATAEAATATTAATSTAVTATGARVTALTSLGGKSPTPSTTLSAEHIIKSTLPPPPTFSPSPKPTTPTPSTSLPASASLSLSSPRKITKSPPPSITSLSPKPTTPTPSSTISATASASLSPPRKDMSCQLCYNGAKDAVLVHGKSGHQMCCYRCAKRLRRYGKPCPICRRQIQRVIRNYVV